jgi:hypothetical protein
VLLQFQGGSTLDCKGPEYILKKKRNVQEEGVDKISPEPLSDHGSIRPDK